VSSEPPLKLHEPPEERPRLTKVEAYRNFIEMLEVKKPRIAQGTRQEARGR
jgi:hypothetical protein